ncbi:MAG: mannose-1-phosphate guanylyltransferase [Kiritimatiellia bacterium]
MSPSNNHVYAVIMAGGRGERFWPLSTAARPKQFLTLFGGKTLLAQAVDRLAGLIPPERILVITSRDLVDATRAAASNLPAANIIGEPVGRDTAAACALACALVTQRDPQGVVCILTADQLMADVVTFRQILADSVAVATARAVIVTIGIQPTYPSTGFGYIEAGEKLESATPTTFHQAIRFVEKPDAAVAAGYLKGGRHYWNAGMFIWRVAVMQQAIEQHAPHLLELCRKAAAIPPAQLDALLETFYPPLPKISVDFAIMEHLSNIVMARGSFGWDDVGTWAAAANHLPADASGNVVVGDCEALDAADNVVISEGRLTAVLGLKNVVVVQAGNVTLVCDRDRVQDLKKLVQQVGRRADGARYV